MTDFADDAQSTFSHAITLQDDNEKANVDDNDYRFETGTLQEKPSLTEKTKKDDDSTASMSKPSDVGSLRVIYGPGTNCVVVSSLIGCKWSYTVGTQSLLASNFQDAANVVTEYAITPHGDELVLYYGIKDKVPGWMWQPARYGKANNSPSYQSLKSWLTGLLTSCPQDFRKTRVTFGSGASYYAHCGDRHLFHDLPPRLHEVIGQYRKALDKARAIKTERETSNPTRRLVEADFFAIPGPLPLKVDNFNDLDNLPTSSLPDCVALGAQGTYVARWGGLCAAATLKTNVLWEQLIDKPVNIARVRYFALSVFNAQHGFILMDDWSYRIQFTRGMLDIVGCLKEHAQVWIKLKPGRSLTWERLPLGGDVTGVFRLDHTTDFKVDVRGKSFEDEEGKNKEEIKQKEKDRDKQTTDKPRRLSRLFGRKEKETTSSS